MDIKSLNWEHPAPHVVNVTVEAADIDILGHTNNVVYLKWLEHAAWEHSKALGLDWPEYQRIGRAMVARRHELDYLAPSFAGEELCIGTWLSDNDGKLSSWRRYQVIRPKDGLTLLRGLTQWVCVDLATGKPRRQPEEFLRAYAVPDPKPPGS